MLKTVKSLPVTQARKLNKRKSRACPALTSFLKMIVCLPVHCLQCCPEMAMQMDAAERSNRVLTRIIWESRRREMMRRRNAGIYMAQLADYPYPSYCIVILN